MNGCVLTQFVFGQYKELPWDQPSTGCAEYVRWKSNDRWTTTTPWSKIDTLALSMLRKILDPNAAKRILLDKIINHKWCLMQFSNAGELKLPNIKLNNCDIFHQVMCGRVMLNVWACCLGRY